VTGWRGPILITGTDTGVGKTIVTAAIAAAAEQMGLRVAVIKPAQTGGDDDAAVVRHLAGPTTTRVLVRYPEPLAPRSAARIADAKPLKLDAVISAVRELSGDHDLVLVEGAGGVLVPMGAGGWTVRDLAVECAMSSIVVARAGLGTINHTKLTLDALTGRPKAVVVGAWPTVPELVHSTNLTDFPGELAGALPEGAGSLEPLEFRRAAPNWLGPVLHGRFDQGSFRELNDERAFQAAPDDVWVRTEDMALAE
jgi:dethiobiotin synthetase